MRVLLLGARGAVGKHTADELRRRGHEVIPAGRTAPTGGVAVTLSPHRINGLTEALGTHAPDVVINTSGVENPDLAAATRGHILLDISATAAYLSALSDTAIQHGTTLISASGLAPGLSTVLAAAVAPQPGDTIRVALTLGSGEKHGPAAVEWTQGLLGRPIDDRGTPGADAAHPARPVLNFTRALTLSGAGVPRRRYLRADFPDQFLLAHTGATVHNYLAMSSAPSTRALQLLTRMPWAGGIMAAAPTMGSDRWDLLAENTRTGRQIGAYGHEQSLATACLTAAAVQALAEGPAFPVTGRVIPVTDLLSLADVAALSRVTVTVGEDNTATPAVPR
ncbi:MAG: NAD-dependent epimerase/dehydratase family protein [Mycetocola sp.]